MPRSKALMKKRTAGPAPKKIVIKPFSKPPTLPVDYYDKTSRELLEGTLSIIFKTDAGQLSLQNSYQQVVNLVSHKYGPRLYQDLVDTMKKACNDYVLQATPETEQLLSHVQTQYQRFVEYLLLCKHVFLPLDRTHAWTPSGIRKRSASEPGTLGLWQVGLLQFQLRLEELLLDGAIYQKWWESLQLDWDGNLSLDQQTLLQSTLYMWQDLAVLAETLSKKLEPDLIQFFEAKSQSMKSDQYNAASVIGYCHAKWMHVAYHWSRFLPRATCVQLLENHLFKSHLQNEWLLNPSHFEPLLEESTQTSKEKPSSIHQLWMLSGRLPGGYKLTATAIAQYARTRGNAMMAALTEVKDGKQRMSAPKTSKQKISELLDLQAQLSKLIKQLPHGIDHCSLKHVWEDVVNPSGDGDSDSNLVAEALAKYVDAHLRDTKKQQPDANWAENIISGIFCYLQAKDVFEAFYKQNLAKRLLWNRIVSMDVERNFVSLLKAECGAGYTSKMEGMFHDMDCSRDIMSRYKQSLAQDESYSGDEVEMDIQVLTTGYWPVYNKYPNIILPNCLIEPRERFTKHYKYVYQGRRMAWQYALGNCLVRFIAPSNSKKYDLVVSPCQALVLLQFNNGEEFTIGQLMAAVGLDDQAEMEAILRSLFFGKENTRVLQKLDHDADQRKKMRPSVHDNDRFRVTPTFSSSMHRIRISSMLMKETKDEREKTVEAVSRDRLYLIDAVLVRIMKARKTISHQQLMPQVLEQVKVPAQPSDVKKRIESLIEREYMERDPKDRTRYNYLA